MDVMPRWIHKVLGLSVIVPLMVLAISGSVLSVHSGLGSGWSNFAR